MNGYVYQFFDNTKCVGTPIYVGKTKNFKNRMNHHFNGVEQGKLTQEAYDSIKGIKYANCKTYGNAGIIERYLICTLKPKYNTVYTNEDVDMPLELEWLQWKKTHKEDFVSRKKTTQKYSNHKIAFTKNNTIRYHNDLANIPLMGFSAAHENIFMVTCYRYQQDLEEQFLSMGDLESYPQEDIPKIRYNISDFSKMCSYKKGGSNRFINDVTETKKRFMSLQKTVSKGQNIEIDYPFFYEFRIDRDAGYFEAQIHKRAAYMLFGLRRDYTQHEIDEFVQIKSIFAKRCYRVLKKWRTVGCWEADFTTFKEVMGVPSSYESRDITKRVIGAIEKELPQYFTNLKVTKIYGEGRGNPIRSIRIIFEKENKNPSKKTKHICPDCGEPLIEKEINGKVCWCHADGWKETAKCHSIFNSILEISEQKQGEPKGEEYVGMPDNIREKLSKAFE